MSKTSTININLDTKCTRCKKRGATTNGLCLKCIEKKMAEGGYDNLFRKGEVSSPKKEKPMPKKSDLPSKPQGEAIEFEHCQIVGVKADLVSNAVRITVAVSFSQLPADVRQRLAQTAELQHPVRVTIQPMQLSLNLQPGRLD